MKFPKLTLYIALASVSFQGCKNDSFLDRFPQDQFSDPTYFQSENDLKLYANKFYDNLPVAASFDADNNSDVMVPRTQNSLLGGSVSVPSAGGGWAASDWLLIRQTNYFLTRYQRAAISNAERYAAEVRFFRALFYWQKVARFGDVPLLLKDLNESSQELFGERVDRSIVMDQVLEDLQFSVTNLPEKGTQETGRLHKDAARALLSRIGLWEGTYRKYHGLTNQQGPLQLSLEASEQLMQSGKYTLYSTGKPLEDYYNLFIQQDLNGNSENILHRPYINGINTQGYSRTATENNTGVSKSFVEQYLFTDGNPIATTSYSYNDAHPASEGSNRDPRYIQTIATPDFIWRKGAGVAEPLKTGLPAIGTSRTTTGYWLIKGRSSDLAQFNANQSDIDAFIFRFGEVLLNFAEAKFELQGTLSQQDLDKSINLLRERVAMPHLLSGVTADPNGLDYGYPIPALLREIRREREIELIGEGLRFNDILRWKAGKLIEGSKSIKGMKLTSQLRNEYQQNGTDVSAVITDAQNYIVTYNNITNNRTWDDKYYLYPIPVDQINLAKYIQNKGW
ncbi:Starch-binding associating with outer membrane [Sphingobacterium nematocida]|uniref:Starch-binding associating with outer membrane n=1 Tax=Sphingobacterium nematocida TaxID=1513896 RepID=A0A1T5AU18_9SPHI|nr:RagB/SusD family nutrient uptake outer membrane protein [Sphingobacterium nematocida]SKB38280.1 Starch-binding associating with outer membrane [Sphingobacterium nematocida]